MRASAGETSTHTWMWINMGVTHQDAHSHYDHALLHCHGSTSCNMLITHFCVWVSVCLFVCQWEEGDKNVTLFKVTRGLVWEVHWKEITGIQMTGHLQCAANFEVNTVSVTLFSGPCVSRSMSFYSSTTLATPFSPHSPWLLPVVIFK